MSLRGLRARTIAAIVVSALTVYAPTHAAQSAAAETKDYTPSVGQEGKDVIWVPTPQSLVDKMLQMATVKPADFVIDLGSGDGRTVITAAKKFGARALGIEYNPEMVELSRRNAQKEGVADRAQFVRGDIFATNFSQATVLTMYLLPSLNLKLRPTILNLKPGTRVVSHAFTMDDWEPDETESSEGRTAYLWIVPAKVEGAWRIQTTGSTPRTYEGRLEQQFQNVQGSLKSENRALVVRNGKLRGDDIVFSVNEEGQTPRTFTGRVMGDRMEGTATAAGSDEKWTAVRVGTR